MDSSYGNESMGRRKWQFLQEQFIKNPKRLHRHSSKPEIILSKERTRVTSLTHISYSFSYFHGHATSRITVVISNC
ncbi:hypothetical protein FCM35_KLT04076 [Carex littledalei]|uniref:Uncharacterized protein n=1 Tax=Carex littledalei TaxID=544730 RepID=A0A833R0Y1_9POAL|nr:hypothetical protein FCM35_KLT04076 [Carex littledalei]